MRCIICDRETGQTDQALYEHYYTHSMREIVTWLLVYQIRDDERGKQLEAL